MYLHINLLARPNEYYSTGIMKQFAGDASRTALLLQTGKVTNKISFSILIASEISLYQNTKSSLVDFYIIKLDFVC